MNPLAGSTPAVRPRLHGEPTLRGLDTTPSSSTTTGRFGRMFRHVPVYEHDPKALIVLGQSMVQPAEADKRLGEKDKDENISLAAGYTYFGQFVDHDITFDPVSSLTRQNDPNALTDFRTPRFDLDSLYGSGPANEPYLYEQPDGLKLLLGAKRPDGADDLQRNDQGRALIGDPRNDENLIVSQLQVTFIKFHNAVSEHVSNRISGLAGADLFKLVQQTVRWHYQWVVIYDFLRRLVGQAVIDDILFAEDYRAPNDPNGSRTIKPRLRFFHWNEDPFMPVEFSVAAYRFGHSMVRPSYLINDFTKAHPPAGRKRIPIFTDQADRNDRLDALNGFRRLPDNGEVEWKYFLPGMAGGDADGLPQPSYKIDTELNDRLGHLPPSVVGTNLTLPDVPEPLAHDVLSSLAVRNLLRGNALGLPAGQDVAAAMGVEPIHRDEILGDRKFAGALLDELGIAGEEAAIRRALAERTPLWFYVLREAELYASGAQLGPVGGRIVAEVLIGLLSGDRLSFLSVNPMWKPTLPSRVSGTFTLTDLVKFALGEPPN